MMIKICHGKMFIGCNGNYCICKLLQLLAFLFLIRSPGIVLHIGEVYEIAPLHGCDQDDFCPAVKFAQFINDDPETAIQCTVAGIAGIVFK